MIRKRLKGFHLCYTEQKWDCREVKGCQRSPHPPWLCCTPELAQEPNSISLTHSAHLWSSEPCFHRWGPSPSHNRSMLSSKLTEASLSSQHFHFSYFLKTKSLSLSLFLLFLFCPYSQYPQAWEYDTHIPHMPCLSLGHWLRTKTLHHMGTFNRWILVVLLLKKQHTPAWQFLPRKQSWAPSAPTLYRWVGEPFFSFFFEVMSSAWHRKAVISLTRKLSLVPFTCLKN